MKFCIYINNPERFAEKDYFLAVNICPDGDREFFVDEKERQVLGEIDIDVDSFHDACVPQAVNDIDKEINQLRVKAEVAISELEARKQNLLAITNEGV